MESVRNKIVLVNDASSPGSECIIRSLLLKGADVIVSSKNLIDLYRLRSGLKLDNALECRNLHLLPFDLKNSKDAEAAREVILKQWKGLDVIVTSHPKAQSVNALLNSNDEEWDRCINLLSKNEFIVAKTFMPLLKSRPGSMLIVISNNAASNPSAASGLGDISSALQLMLARALSNEIEGNPDIHCLILSEEYDCSENDDHITLKNISEAIAMLIENSAWVKGHPEYNHNWREQMTPPDESYCVGGI